MQGILRLIFIWLIMISSLHASAQKEVTLTGVYKGDPLYIQNPYHPGLKNFCINSIYVNEKSLTLDYNLSAIKLNFSEYDLYTPVRIKIDYKDVCKPTIVNKDAILFHSSFKYTDIALTDSLLSWSTKGDRPGAVFEIEKLYGDGWSVVTTINSTGDFAGDQYQFIPELSSGANKYRIKYKVSQVRYLYSNEVELEFYPDPVELINETVANVLRLNRVSDFRIEDPTGEVMLTGTGKAIDVSHLKAGEYYIFFDDLAFRFLKNTK